MTSILDISASSDSEDDVDYVPNGAASDSSFTEEVASGNEDLNAKKIKTVAGEEDAEIKSDSSSKFDEKQRAKDLYESFLNDVEPVTPKSFNPVVCNSCITTEIQNDCGAKAPEISSLPVCKVIKLPGSTNTFNTKYISDVKQTALGKNNSEPNRTEKPSSLVPKKRGVNSVLGTIMNKNKKLSVLEKTLIDWKMFKKDEGLENELEKFNKGKQGFIEKQQFLERSDLRTFEIEKSMRQRSGKK